MSGERDTVGPSPFVFAPYPECRFRPAGNLPTAGLTVYDETGRILGRAAFDPVIVSQGNKPPSPHVIFASLIPGGPGRAPTPAFHAIEIERVRLSTVDGSTRDAAARWVFRENGVPCGSTAPAIQVDRAPAGHWRLRLYGAKPSAVAAIAAHNQGREAWDKIDAKIEGIDLGPESDHLPDGSPVREALALATLLESLRRQIEGPDPVDPARTGEA